MHPDDEGIHDVGELLRWAARRWPEQALVFPHERSTFAELDRSTDRLAVALEAAGVARRDKVGILLGPGLDFLRAVFATGRAGGTVVPINDRLKADEVTHVVVDADLRALVTSEAEPASPDFPSVLQAGLPGLAQQGQGPLSLPVAPELRRIVVLGPSAPRAGFTPATWLEGEISPPPGLDRAVPRTNDRDDLAYILYTSGTSAKPKGCMITHDAVLRQGWAMAETRYLLGPDDSFWCPLPLFHNGGLASLMVCLVSGARYVHAGRFDPGESIAMMQQERCTHAIPAFETILLRILDHPDYATADLSALRVVLNVGSVERLREFQERMPQATQISNYGITEATGHLTVGELSDPLDVRLTTGGRPLPGMEVRVTEPETGVDLPVGERGEIRFRGPMRFVGYYGQPEYTASVIDADGWFRTGDLGVLDDGGRLTYAGRLKDMLKVGGENVAATEVEGFLVRHPAVNIAAVVGAPDAVYSEVPAAFVELVPGATLDEQDLIDFCLGSIATYKVPRYVRIVDTWPMSGTKIQKYVLRERIANELAERGITAAPRLSSSARSAGAR